MKHILPILTLTTLAAAASAQSAAAPAGLNYNYVGFTRDSQENVLTAQFEKSNVVIRAAVDSNDDQVLSLGYVFKNLVAGVDAAVLANQASDGDSTSYGVELRRSLSEFLPGLEVGLNYASTFNGEDSAQIITHGSSKSAQSAWSVELAYNVTKQIQFAIAHTDHEASDRSIVASIRLAY